jgi:hypothetical protein
MKSKIIRYHLQELIKRVRNLLFTIVENTSLLLLKILPSLNLGAGKNIIITQRAGRGLTTPIDDELFLRTLKMHAEFKFSLKRFNQPFWIIDSFGLILLSIFSKKLHLVLIQYIHQYHKFPSENLLRVLQFRGCRITKIWHDSYNKDLWQKRILKISEIGTNNFIVDTPELITKFRTLSNNYYYSPPPIQDFKFVPHNQRSNFLYYSGGLSTSGLYRERKDVIDYLRHNEVDISGMQYDRINFTARPTYEEYRKELASSLCGLNFTWKGDADVLPARTWEILSSGVLLLQNKSTVFKENFVSGVHYLDFSSKEELLEIIQSLKKNTNLIQDISIAGKEKFNDLFKSSNFWPRIFS